MSELPIALAVQLIIKRIEGDGARLLPYTNMYVSILQVYNQESGNTPHCS